MHGEGDRLRPKFGCDPVTYAASLRRRLDDVVFMIEVVMSEVVMSEPAGACKGYKEQLQQGPLF